LPAGNESKSSVAAASAALHHLAIAALADRDFPTALFAVAIAVFVTIAES
jgi:hypothetical protein